MLYYIVPPIIIVLSLAFLISFLFRKFSAAGRANLDLLEDMNGAEAARAGGSRVGSFFSQFWFRILERMTQHLKLLSLKMHNASNNWFHSVRNKRERVHMAEVERSNEGGVAELRQERKDFAPAENIKTETASGSNEEIVIRRKPRLENFSIKQRIVRKRFMPVKKEEPAKPAPMEKNRLEDALIKRIAVNPKDIEAYERLGDYYSDIKNFKDAVECYKQVTKLSPRNLKAKVKLRSLERILKR
ncbi:MAG TPA: hypothetical protein DCX32_02050 [Candidatus Moranbacteria bacterium]|nr:MAG: hypothetical protein UW87_C0004G0023 [Candidatus Moranbacteria bacterium GW2011_GWC2_45_10]KKT95481.1 MAG: hypothetical protein UW95_C0001G0045 [Parcubacteria group bacterium GW2011_GWC1_45_14]HAV11305.1 hypothetical protein [Candidatus Moranbacteria bacterium]